MAHQEVPVGIAEVHAVAAAVSEGTAIGAGSGAHPFAMAVAGEAFGPHIHEVILIDRSLMEVGAYARTGRDAAVAEHRTDRDACLAAVEAVSHFGLIVAEKSLAAVACLDGSLLPGVFDELHHLAELVAGEAHGWVGSGPSDRENGEQAPRSDAFRDEKIAQGRQFVYVAGVGAGHYVVGECRLRAHQVKGPADPAEAFGVSAHPVMVFLQSVEADGECVETGSDERLQFF